VDLIGAEGTPNHGNAAKETPGDLLLTDRLLVYVRFLVDRFLADRFVFFVFLFCVRRFDFRFRPPDRAKSCSSIVLYMVEKFNRGLRVCSP